MRTLKFFVPLGLFLILVGILAAGFFLEDAKILPSELVGKPMPEFELVNVMNPEQVMRKEDILGSVAILNVWATWCPNCLMEHPTLLDISINEDVKVIGINYNDDISKAQAWLKRYKDPYWVSLADTNGRLGIDLGVYGAPETFIMDAEGQIRFRYVGPVTHQVWKEKFVPIIKDIRSTPSQG